MVAQVPSARLVVYLRGGHLEPDADFIYMQAEPKQNICFSGISHDLLLCNKTVSATNTQFPFCLMEIGFFMGE